ncbi:flagellar basal body P-ring formation chaperone FlgA [Pseudocolwellia sp. HL-MZ19]|uniref:flagellar basal body P-ring formation chaperone FlgA n=1 Tax=unclassified Pseudocolwellia TaxID=2848178 RepID=UPI003CE7F084
MKILPTLFFIFSLISFHSAGNTIDKDNLVKFVELFVKNNIDSPRDGKLEISLPELDPRLTIKPCEAPLQANIPENHNGRNINVKIYCEDEIPWQMYIPVKISQEILVLVTQNVLAKGTVINQSNTITEYTDINSVRGETITNVAQITGGRLKRRLSKGAVVSPRNVCLVCEGESVTIIAQSDGFTIKTAGIALTDGSKGEQVQIRNSKSGRTINARVEAVNQVRINL